MMPIVPILLLSVVGLSTCAWQPPAALLRTGSVGRSASQLRWHSSPVLQMAPLPDDELAQLIQKLRAVTPEELPKLLAENLKQIDQRLFIRLAEMSDAEQDDYEKLRIRQLATLVASSIETILDQADKQMSADAEAVQSLLRTMALDDGEFELPIPAAQLGALRNAIRSANPPLDEGFVGTVKAYMKKSDDDGLAGMVDVLRILLQTFAAERLRSLSAGSQVDADEGIQTALAAVLDATPEEWDETLRAQLLSDNAVCGAEEFTTLLQDKMGEVVLGMPAGSNVQNVIAEYLNELIGRARAIASEEV